MRIGQIVAQAQQSSQIGAQTASKRVEAPPNPGLAKAQQANQARLTDAAKGYTQAVKVRDGVSDVAKALDQAQELVKKAADPALSADGRKQLQADFIKALAAVDQGAKAQAGAGADPQLANSVYDPTRVAPVSADRLGGKASGTYSSVAALGQLDLTTASSDQLAEAGKVLAAAKTETANQATAANQQVDRIAGRVDKFDLVKAALEGGTPASTRQQRDAQVIANLLQQQNTPLNAGSLLNIIA
jgi:hypothetical protein